MEPVSPVDDAFRAWSIVLSTLCRRELGLALEDLPTLALAEAYALRLTPASAFEELILASLRLGRWRAHFRLFGDPARLSRRSFTPEELDAATAVHDVSPQPSETCMATWVDFAEIRRRVSLEDVLFTLYGITTLKREGRKLIGPCPVHGGDSTRAFHADLDKNVWHCFSQCQGGGNQLDFVAKKESINIRDAALKLQAFFLTEGAASAPAPSAPATPTPAVATTAPAKAPPAVPPRATTATMPSMAKAEPPSTATTEDEPNRPLTFTLALKGDHPHLVTERALKAETIAAFGVGYCSKGTLRGQIAIPIHDEDGDLVAYAGRRLKPSDIRERGKYAFPKGFQKSRVLYRYHVAKAAMAEQGLILVEGFFAAMKLYEAGLTQAVASMGVELSPYQAKLMHGAKDLVVLFDGDDAGREGADKIRAELGATIPVRLIRLPAGVKPDQCSPKLLRWLVNGVRALDLVEVTFTPKAL